MLLSKRYRLFPIVTFLLAMAIWSPLQSKEIVEGKALWGIEQMFDSRPGVKLYEIETGGAVYSAGLKAGDIIAGYRFSPGYSSRYHQIMNTKDLNDLIDTSPPYIPIYLTINRRG